MADDKTIEEWVYTGRRESVKGTLLQAFQRPDGTQVAFKQLVRGGVIGGHYEVKTNADASRVESDPKYMHARSHEKTEEWAALDRAAALADTVRKRAAKDARESRDLGGMTLAELSSLYVRLPAPQAMALEVQVMARLRQVRAS
jgi:hypothetical protein